MRYSDKLYSFILGIPTYSVVASAAQFRLLILLLITTIINIYTREYSTTKQDTTRVKLLRLNIINTYRLRKSNLLVRLSTDLTQ